MKRYITSLMLIVSFFTTMSFARTPQEAAQIASRFFASQASSSIPSAQRASQQGGAVAIPVDLAYTQYTADHSAQAVFVFNHSDEGFVLVSAEDDARPVLGYSDTGRFDATDIPANMAFWLQMYADEIADYQSANQSRTTQRLARKQLAADYQYTPIAPLLGDMQWGQDVPFNNYAPTINGSKTPAGCVATAVAQIMYTHKYPTTGTGSHSYTLSSYGITLSANFGQTTYDWENMLPYYSKNNYTAEQADAVATLLFHLGVSMDMGYAPGGSGTLSTSAMDALTTYFGYDAGILTLLKDYLTEKQMLDQMYAELLTGRPIYMSGATVNNEGHAFVCDGIKENGYLHINWGWNGSCDGYYALSALNPENQGTGGSSTNLAFTESVDAYIGIKPDEGGSPTPFLSIQDYTLTAGNSISATTPVRISCTTFCNWGLGKAQGPIYYVVYNENGERIQEISIGSTNLDTYHYYRSIEFGSGQAFSLPDGKYELAVELHQDNQWFPIHLRKAGALRLPMIVEGETIYFENILREDEYAQTMTKAQVVNVNQTNTWDIDFTSDNFWGDSQTDQILRLRLHSNSPNSIIGSYRLDTTNSGEAGTINGDVTFAVGCGNGCYIHTVNDLHLTITNDKSNNLVLQFRIDTELMGVIYKTYVLTPTWYVIQGEDYYYYSDYITNDLAAAIPADKAVELINTFPDDDRTPIRFYVQGYVITMTLTPEEILQHDVAEFNISADGMLNDVLECYDIKGIDGDYHTGYEIEAGDDVTLYGVLKLHYDGSPIIEGKLAAITKGTSPVDYSITRLELLRIEDMKVYFEWESLAPQVEVAIYDGSNKLIGTAYTTVKQPSFKAPKIDTYILRVTPLDEDKNILGATAELVVDMHNHDYTIRNLTIDIDYLTFAAAWESDANTFHIKLFDGNNEQIGNNYFTDKTLSRTLPAGDYTLWIRPMNDSKSSYLAEAVSQTFTLTDPSTAVEDILAPDAKVYLYDLLGRMIDSQSASLDREWNVPSAGLYILIQANHQQKIFIQ